MVRARQKWTSDVLGPARALQQKTTDKNVSKVLKNHRVKIVHAMQARQRDVVLKGRVQVDKTLWTHRKIELLRKRWTRPRNLRQIGVGLWSFREDTTWRKAAKSSDLCHPGSYSPDIIRRIYVCMPCDDNMEDFLF